MRIIEGFYEMQQCRNQSKQAQRRSFRQKAPTRWKSGSAAKSVSEFHQSQLISSDLCREESHAKNAA
jgi:chemotaxis methyl-accepting protein methylase